MGVGAAFQMELSPISTKSLDLPPCKCSLPLSRGRMEMECGARAALGQKTFTILQARTGMLVLDASPC